MQKDGRKNYFQRLRPPAGTALDIAPLEIAIVIPDVHLGWGTTSSDSTTRHASGVWNASSIAFSDLKQHVNGNLEVFQVGDWYDFCALTRRDAFASQSHHRIAIPKVWCRARAIWASEHCVGNHDAALAEADIRHGMNVEIVRSIGTSKRVISLTRARHGKPGQRCRPRRRPHDRPRTSSTSSTRPCPSWVPLVPSCSARSTAARSTPGARTQPAFLGTRPPFLARPVRGAPWVGRGSTIELGAALSGLELCIDRELQAGIRRPQPPPRRLLESDRRPPSSGSRRRNLGRTDEANLPWSPRRRRRCSARLMGAFG